MFSKFEAFRTFLYAFTSVLNVFVRYEEWVYVPVAGFSPTEDSCRNVFRGHQHCGLIFPETLFISLPQKEAELDKNVFCLQYNLSTIARAVSYF